MFNKLPILSGSGGSSSGVGGGGMSSVDGTSGGATGLLLRHLTKQRRSHFPAITYFTYLTFQLLAALSDLSRKEHLLPDDQGRWPAATICSYNGFHSSVSPSATRRLSSWQVHAALARSAPSSTRFRISNTTSSGNDAKPVSGSPFRRHSSTRRRQQGPSARAPEGGWWRGDAAWLA